MMEMPPLPIGCKITIHPLEDGVELRWATPAGPGRQVAMVLAIFGLIALAIAVFHIVNIITTHSSLPFLPGERWRFASLLFTFASSISAILVYVLNPPRPEVLRLAGDTLFHSGGYDPTTENALQNHTFSSLFAKPIITSISRAEIIGIHVNHVHPQACLLIHLTGRSLEIGHFLLNPDREWVAAVLKEWMAGQPCRSSLS